MTALIAVTVVCIGAYSFVLAGPFTLRDWIQHPIETWKLARGINPHPVTLNAPPVKPLSDVAQFGRELFFDPRLSSSTKMSCASCHDPSRAYGPPGETSVVLGGPQLLSSGFRAVPSLRYLYRQPPFKVGADLSDEDQAGAPASQLPLSNQSQPVAQMESESRPVAEPDVVPQGGLFWDGRVDTLQQQARAPLFNPVEMDAGSVAQVSAKLAAGYANEFRKLFGPLVLQDPDETVTQAMYAIARFEIEDPSFHPFTSKYDAWLAGKARFTQAELRGYLAFNDPKKGNCAACHLDKPGSEHLPPLFTDFQYEALGLPRNPAIPANRNTAYFDLGVCGPFRLDMQQERQYCGMFLTPSLRNVATRHVFFHNGVFHTLHEVLDWYVNRDLSPARFYPRDRFGQVEKYNDLPFRYQPNVDTFDAPFNRHAGQRPALTEADIKNVIAFLHTLTDADVKGTVYQ